MPALSKPTNGSNADYAARIGALFDAFNNGNYNFPATQVASADANTLDDYEEGTFTPNVGGTATYTIQTGYYTKIGRLVSVTWEVAVNVLGTGSVSVISGLPFTALIGNAPGHCGFFINAGANFTFVSFYLNGTTASVTAIAAAGVTMGTPSVFFANAARITGGANYIVA